ncbi:hypothetical protein T190820D02B_10150 [Tenacibaculum sp. 190524A05c]
MIWVMRCLNRIVRFEYFCFTLTHSTIEFTERIIPLTNYRFPKNIYINSFIINKLIDYDKKNGIRINRK